MPEDLSALETTRTAVLRQISQLGISALAPSTSLSGAVASPVAIAPAPRIPATARISCSLTRSKARR